MFGESAVANMPWMSENLKNLHAVVANLWWPCMAIWLYEILVELYKPVKYAKICLGMGVFDD